MYVMRSNHQYSYSASLTIGKIQGITKILDEDTDVSNNNPLKYNQFQIFYLE